MSIINTPYSNTNGFNPIAKNSANPLILGIVLSVVVLIHLYLAFYLLKSEDLNKVEPPLVMTVEMQLQASTSAPTPPTPPKAPEKVQPIKPQPSLKKPAPPTPKLKELKAAPKELPTPKPKDPEPIPSASPTTPPKPDVVPPASAPTPVEAAPTQPNVAAPTASQANPAAPTSTEISAEVKPILYVKPIYPPIAIRREREGWVKIEFTIKADGTVSDATVIDAEPEEIFDEAALTAVKEWKFAPKIVDGVAVNRRATKKVQFKLEH